MLALAPRLCKLLPKLPIQRTIQLTHKNRTITATQDNTLAYLCQSPQFPCIANGGSGNFQASVYAKKAGGSLELGIYSYGIFQTWPFSSTSYSQVSSQILALTTPTGNRAPVCIVMDIPKAGTSVTFDDVSISK